MTFHLYKINELYSNADGSAQFIEMTVGNFEDEGHWAGHAISVTQGGTTHSFTFPTDLPNETTANTTVLIATQAFANLGIVHPDFIIPAGFLFTNGGTVNYADVDTFSYALLPTNGSTALYRTGSTAPAVATDFAGASASANVITVAQALANPNGPPAAIVDSAANVANGLDGLQVLTAQGKLTAVAQTDAPNPVVISGAQVASDAATLALIAGPYNLGVVVAGGSFSYSLAGNVAGLNVSGESSASIVGNASFNTITLGSGNDSVTAGGGGSYIVTNGGNAVLLGGGGGASGSGNTIYAFGGNNYLQGGAGSPSDVLVATGAGSDTFYGGSGNNYIVGGTGQNTIVGGGGALQSLYGNGTADYIVGGSGSGASNVLVEENASSSGNDSLWGGLNSSNYIVGGGGNELLVGGSLSDYIFAGTGNDTIYGGNGTDYIYTGPGTDFIWTDNIGSQSTDYIYETPTSGTNTIADFTPGDGANHDVLDFSGTNLHSFANVQVHAVQGPGSPYTVITASPTDQVYLYNVQPFQLTANDFIFA